MSDRPPGDAVDQELRRLMSDIASVPGPAPEFDELYSPVLTLEGERTMSKGVKYGKYGLLVAAAAVIAIVVGVVLFVGDGDDDGLDTIDQPDVTTTVTIAAEETTTASSNAAAPASTVPESTASTISPSRATTWTDYTGQVEPRRATLCAVAPIRELAVPLILNDDQQSIYERAFGDSEFSYVVELDTGIRYLDALDARLAVELGALEQGPSSADGAVVLDYFSTVAATAEEVRSGVGAEAEVIDLGPVFRSETVSIPRADATCVFTPNGGQSTLLDAFSTFSGTSATLGGRGLAAGARCSSFAAWKLVLEQVVESGSEVARQASGDSAVTLVETYWDDRPIDQAVVELVARWRAIEFVDGLATPDQLVEVEGVLDDLLSYRASLPEGDILCPLDDGWEG